MTDINYDNFKNPTNRQRKSIYKYRLDVIQETSKVTVLIEHNIQRNINTLSGYIARKIDINLNKLKKFIEVSYQ